MATAWSHQPVQERLWIEGHDDLAWPASDGDLPGLAVKPLHPTVPALAQRDPQLHEWLALVDCLRLGRTRERAAVAEALEEELIGEA